LAAGEAAGYPQAPALQIIIEELGVIRIRQPIREGQTVPNFPGILKVQS
jgi:hypothetical protein